MALPILVYTETGSALLTSTVVALESAPYLVFGLLAGALADRMPRRSSMVAADVISAVVLGTVPAAWLAGALTMAHVLLAATLAGTTFVWFDSASWGALPRLVGKQRLPEANGIVWSSAIVVSIAVPGITGLVVSVTDPVLILAVDAGSYLISAGVILTQLAALRGSSRDRGDQRRRRVSGHGR